MSGIEHEVDPIIQYLAWGVGAVLLGIAALHAWRAFGIGAAAPSIAAAPDGDASLIGVAGAFGDTPHATPYRGEPCVWFEASIEEWITTRDSDNKESGRWDVVRHTHNPLPFLLRDGTDVVRVEAAPANLVALPRRQWSGGTLEPEREREDLRRTAVSTAAATTMAIGGSMLAGGVLGGGRFRYTEQWVPPSVNLFVRGGLGRGDAPKAPLVRRSSEVEEAYARLEAEVPRRVAKPARGQFIVAGEPPDALRRRLLLLAAAWAAGAVVLPLVIWFVVPRL